MMLVSIELERPGVDLHRFQCAICNHELTTLAAYEDPLHSKALGRWLQGDLHPPKTVMTVGFKRWLQRDTIQAAGRIVVAIGNDVIAPLLCEEFNLFRGELATTAVQVEHQQMIIEPTYCA